MSLFEWVGKFIDLLISFVPRFARIRATHRGVKWPFCGRPIALGSGIRWYWPLFTEIEIMVVARQTKTLPPQSITTKDGESVSVRGVAVYSIDDIVAAIGEKNWDVDDTVGDLAQAAIMEVCGDCTRNQLRQTKEINRRISTKCREAVRKYGVNLEECKLLECVDSKTYRVLTDHEYSVFGGCEE